MHRGKSDTCSWKIRFHVQSLEWAKKRVGVGHVETCAVVANEEHYFLLLAGCANRNLNVLGLGCELPRIAKKVFESHSQEPAIGIGKELVLNGYCYRPIRLSLSRLVENVVSDLRQIDAVAREFGSADAREQEKVVDQFAH